MPLEEKKKFERVIYAADLSLLVQCKQRAQGRQPASLTIMHRTYKHGTKARLGCGKSACRWEKHYAGNGTFAALYCAIFLTPSFRKSLKFFGTSIASLDPETVQLPVFSVLSAMFTGACGPPEKLSLALVQRSYDTKMAADGY